MTNNSRPTIVIVTNQLKNILSGVGTVANSLINRLSQDFDLLVICPESEKRNVDLPGVTVTTVSPAKYDLTNHRWLSFGKAAWNVVKRLDSSKCKLVLFMDAREGYYAKNSRIPTLGIIHDFYAPRFAKLSRDNIRQYPDWYQRIPYFKVMKMLEQRAYNRLSQLVAVSDMTKQEVQSHYRVRTPITVIRNGLDYSHLSKPEGAKQPKTVMFAGGNFYRKGLPELLQAIEIVAQTEPDIKCYVLGKDKFASKLQAVSPHAEFLGQLDYPTTIDYFQKCQVFCMPSRFESYGMVFLEALYYNMQVIATSTSGIVEVKDYFNNLHIVEPGDSTQLAQAILKALKAPAVTTDPASIERVSSDVMRKGYVDVITQMINA